MKEKKGAIQAFRFNDYGLVDYPKKISNVQIARIFHGEERGCDRCFPHGFETDNSSISKNKKNWKFYRKHQWRN